MSAFDYPAALLPRKHGPRGYAHYEAYRPWLRDEYAFRCVYCLAREQWGRCSGEFALDHFIPSTVRPDLATDYDNLVYACTRCNLAKSAQHVPDPMANLTSDNLRLCPDGTLEGKSGEANRLILKLDLNSPQMVSWRLIWVRIIELAADYDESLYHRIMGFPRDLPNLARLRPPGGNSRPLGIASSHFVRASEGRLPISY